MMQEIRENHKLDQSGMPAGGVTTGVGFVIAWQDGPLGRHAADCREGGPCIAGCTREEPNGAFVEDIVSAAIGRLDFYQTASHAKFACEENATALNYLHLALQALHHRTQLREARKVEGTHTP